MQASGAEIVDGTLLPNILTTAMMEARRLTKKKKKKGQRTPTLVVHLASAWHVLKLTREAL